MGGFTNRWLLSFRAGDSLFLVKKKYKYNNIDLFVRELERGQKKIKASK